MNCKICDELIGLNGKGAKGMCHRCYARTSYQADSTKQRENARRYYERNKARIQKSQKVWHEKNKDRVKEYNQAYQARNQQRLKAYRAEWNKNNRDHLHDRDLRHKRGITRKDYLAMLKVQNGGCGICKSKNGSRTKRNLCVDHDHATGLIRGLLCSRCNMAIGLLKDEIALLKSAVSYLKKH